MPHVRSNLVIVLRKWAQGRRKIGGRKKINQTVCQ